MNLNNSINKKKEILIEKLIDYYNGELSKEKIKNSWAGIINHCEILNINFHEFNKRELTYLENLRINFRNKYNYEIIQYHLQKKYQRLLERGKIEEAKEVFKKINK